MKWIAFLLFISSAAFGNQEYLDLLKQFPDGLGRNGCWKHGEIEIATSPSEIKRIEKHSMQKLIRMGFSHAEANQYSRVGIIGQDHYWIWVRDAVTFPGGIPGTYDRIVRKAGLSGPSSVVILPILPNKKVIVNINFRHATRAWELELPRGKREKKETPEHAALRELKEETGCISDQLIFLGDLSPHSGVVAGTVPVYYSQVKGKTARHQDESEAIASNIELTLDELKEAFTKGYTIIEIKGTKTKVYCRDPFLSFALLQAIWNKLL